jgi:hypothetical protein
LGLKGRSWEISVASACRDIKSSFFRKIGELLKMAYKTICCIIINGIIPDIGCQEIF